MAYGASNLGFMVLWAVEPCRASIARKLSDLISVKAILTSNALMLALFWLEETHGAGRATLDLIGVVVGSLRTLDANVSSAVEIAGALACRASELAFYVIAHPAYWALHTVAHLVVVTVQTFVLA